MKMQFRGWKREEKVHNHAVAPIKISDSGTYMPQEPGPMIWNGPFQAFGKVSSLALTGSFLVEFTFEEKELRDWLAKYVKARPESAVRLLAEAQAEALIALNATPRVQPPAP
jgi:hypothetical protein